MMFIRPAKYSDIDGLLALAGKTGSGLTTLPEDRDLLRLKVERSLNSFIDDIYQPGPEYYFFILEDAKTGHIAGTSALAATVGLEEAFYNYHLGKTVHTSPELNVYNVTNTLYLGNDYTGTTEICTLFLEPKYRIDGNGSLLSRCRFLFMAMHMKRFAPKVIAELRGISDELGNSPFWDALGRHFFSMSFAEADALSGEGRNQFIAELMPKYPIYLALLPESARAVIGQVHPNTKPALAMLKKEGFEYKNYVDIFDAGPTVEVQAENIQSIKDSHNYKVAISDSSEQETFLIANDQVADFRSAYVPGRLDEDHIQINAEYAELMKVSEGQTVRAYCTGKKIK